MIDWNWPVEWQDGTAAWIAEDKEQPAMGRVVRSMCEPSRWCFKRLPKLKGGRVIMVEEDGTLGRGPGLPKLRNVQMPELRFDDGEKPTGGSITNDGTILRLRHPDGHERAYEWPTLKPLGTRKTPLLIERSIRDLNKVEAIKESMAEMEDNPLFGAF